MNITNATSHPLESYHSSYLSRIMIEKQHHRCSRIHERGGPEYWERIGRDEEARQEFRLLNPGFGADVKGSLIVRRGVVVIRFER